MLTAIQSRLSDLLAAEPEFAGIPILVDTRPDFVNAMAEAIGRQDLVVVIGFAAGEADAAFAPRAYLRETVRVAIIQHRLHTAHAATALIETAMLAIHDKPLVASTSTPERFALVSHSSAVDEDGLIVCECVVSISILLRR